MKDIGEKFKSAREYIGISEAEAATDMGITEALLENLEDGNANAFKDIYFLKDLIKKYAKYLNLDVDELLDEYNEFMFNYTSKIPISEIEKKVSELERAEAKDAPKKVMSPYTSLIKKEKKKPTKIIITVVSIILLVALTFFIVTLIRNKANSNDFVGINFMKGVTHEYTK